MPADVKAKHTDVNAQLAAIEKQRPKLLPMALAIGERGRVAQPSFFLFRGSADSPGSQVTPGVLSVVSETEWTFSQPPPNATSSGAGAAGEWLTWKDNPLTARVMVNRMWQHHFGEGIARTPGNFGKMAPALASGIARLAALEFVDRAGA
jgi:hypothetical protein